MFLLEYCTVQCLLRYLMLGLWKNVFFFFGIPRYLGSNDIPHYLTHKIRFLNMIFLS